ncbi:unnamed protein product, partial [Soboliphyme baturini]|uniref:ANK_REP_REGION domain-containing protein n=1 Tax=Soboliphyme baturini TaxID=241478 RepID=A0A183IN90_9BILA
MGRRIAHEVGSSQSDNWWKSRHRPKRQRLTTASRCSFCPRSERQQLALLRRKQVQAQAQVQAPVSSEVDGSCPIVSRSSSSSSSLAAVPPEPAAVAAPASPRGHNVARSSRRNNCGETLLHIAARRGNTKRCSELLDEGADVNAITWVDWQSATNRARRNVPAIERGLSVVFLSILHPTEAFLPPGWTPLHEACNQGRYEVAKLLIEHQADVFAKGLEDDTPLHDAVRSGNTELIQLLLCRGADPLQNNALKIKPIDLCVNDDVKRVLLGTVGVQAVEEHLDSFSQETNSSQNTSESASADSGLFQQGIHDDRPVVIRLAFDAMATENFPVSRGLSSSVSGQFSEADADKTVVAEFAANPDGSRLADPVSTGDGSGESSSLTTAVSVGGNEYGGGSVPQTPSRTGPHTRRYLKRSRGSSRQQHQQQEATRHCMKRKLSRRDTMRKTKVTAAVDVYEFHTSDSENESSLPNISPSYRCKIKSTANGSNRQQQPPPNIVELPVAVSNATSLSSPPPASTPVLPNVERQQQLNLDVETEMLNITVTGSAPCQSQPPPVCSPPNVGDTTSLPVTQPSVMASWSNSAKRNELTSGSSLKERLLASYRKESSQISQLICSMKSMTCQSETTVAVATTDNLAVGDVAGASGDQKTIEGSSVLPTVVYFSPISMCLKNPVSDESDSGEARGRYGAPPRYLQCADGHTKVIAAEPTTSGVSKTASPKVPPLKLVLSNPGRKNSEDEPGKDGSPTYVVRSENHSPEIREEASHCHKADDAAKRTAAPVESSHRI